MAITTLPGASGTDFTTLVGTDGNDSFALTESNLYISALEGADTVTAADTLENIKFIGGTGKDTVTLSGALEQGFIRLDADDDNGGVNKDG